MISNRSCCGINCGKKEKKGKKGKRMPTPPTSSYTSSTKCITTTIISIICEATY
jgi:hypothetical protein